MKPEQFIREFGLGNVKTLIEKFEKDQFSFKSFDHAADCCFDAGLCMGQEKAWWDICIYDLTRLVQSLDLFKELKTKKNANREFMKACMRGQTERANQIKRAMETQDAVFGKKGASHE